MDNLEKKKDAGPGGKLLRKQNPPPLNSESAVDSNIDEEQGLCQKKKERTKPQVEGGGLDEGVRRKKRRASHSFRHNWWYRNLISVG